MVMRGLLMTEGVAEDQDLLLESDLAHKSGSSRRLATLAGLGFGVGLLVVGFSFDTSVSSSRRAEARRVMQLIAEGRCHTAVEGEICYQDVQWARGVGIVNHTDWYSHGCPLLTATSSNEDFQACLFKINSTNCPLPCNPKTLVPETVVAQTRADNPQHAVPVHADPCHIAARGETCYTDVAQAMLIGIAERPEEFPGLSSTSTFEEVQAFLHKSNSADACPRPCTCHIVTSSSHGSCYGHVLWARKEGIRKHPAWYEGLSAKSSFQEIQGYLHKDAKATCPLPCSGITAERLREEDAKPAPTEPPHAESCHEMAWPDRANGLTCGDCKVLVDRFQARYKTCRGFCMEIGRECAGAWESRGTSCAVSQVSTCDEPIPAPTAICECGEAVPDFGAAALTVPADVVEHHGPASVEDTEDHCHTTTKGEECYDNVVYGMKTGLFEHPEWYPDLDQFSSFEEFQAILHHNPELKCPRPCECHTARKGDDCYGNIRWVLHEGITKHPDWYGTLKETSRWEDIQARLHEDEGTVCKTPCTKKVWGTPSLFCFSVFRSTGYELDLVKSQVEKGVGIFSCDEFAVLSDKVLTVTAVVKTLIIPPCEEVGTSKDGTAANTLIFMQAWNVIHSDVRYKAHDWVIKADPDAVVLVDRLRAHLAPYTGENVWMKNCMKWTGIGWPMMFGSLEAYSHRGLETYFAGAEQCKRDLEWQAWGEDLYMGRCLKLLGAKAEFDGGLIGDNVCKGADCSDGTSGAYHPFKSPEAWFECYNQAMGVEVFK